MTDNLGNIRTHFLTRRVLTRSAISVAALCAIGCAHVPTARLEQYDLQKGYRFDALSPGYPKSPRNSDGVFVILAFSGGGTRAAAMSYGVLAQLRAVRLYYDSTKDSLVSCNDAASPRCKAMERSLLDEVDVVSSVSGGSFTSAYYALYGDSIFNRQSTFQDRFLYHRVQSDLVKQAVYYPRNWKWIRARAEIAADYHARNIFGNLTFADLEHRPRPYLILNATDASTGGRFEFSQEQFDPLCADLSATKVARGVAASSAFPVLLNTLTIENHSANNGCRYHVPLWVANGLRDRNLNPQRYRLALEQASFRDPARKYLHLLDGGLADNIGLRGIIGGLESTDQPNDTLPDGTAILGGWSLLRRLQNEPIKQLVVITVNARTNQPTGWDRKASGPGLVSVVDASAGIPLGNFTNETIELMRRTVNEKRDDPDVPFFVNTRFHAMSISLDDVADTDERTFLNNAGTNFELPEFIVNCLMSRSAELIRDGQMSGDSAGSTQFSKFVHDDLNGTIASANVPSPAHCTEKTSKTEVKKTSHTVDVALRYTVSRPYRRDIDEREGFGLTLRVAKPNGFGATAGVTMPAFGVPATLNQTNFTLGRLRLYGVIAGGVLSRSLGPVEISSSMNVGYALGNFRTTAEAHTVFGTNGVGDTRVRSTGTWLAKPGISLWHSLFAKYATTVSASYLIARPELRFKGRTAMPNRPLHVNALQLSAGIGYRIF